MDVKVWKHAVGVYYKSAKISFLDKLLSGVSKLLVGTVISAFKMRHDYIYGILPMKPNGLY